MPLSEIAKEYARQESSRWLGSIINYHESMAHAFHLRPVQRLYVLTNVQLILSRRLLRTNSIQQLYLGSFVGVSRRCTVSVGDIMVTSRIHLTILA